MYYSSYRKFKQKCAKAIYNVKKNVSIGFCRFDMNKVVPIILHNFNLFWINVYDQFNLNYKYKFV